jgi:hypothetical protein
MIYELGKELQTTNLTDEHATEVMVSRLKQELASASSACFMLLSVVVVGLIIFKYF